MIIDEIKTVEQLIDSITASLRCTGLISSITDNLDGTANITTNTTKGLNIESFVTIGGSIYQVLEVIDNVTFKVIGLPVGVEWVENAPYYFYGNLVQQSNEIDTISDSNNKYPAFILNEISRSNISLNVNDSIEEVANLEIFIMDIADYTDWSIEEFYTNTVDKMDALARMWVAAAKSNKYTGSMNEITYQITKVSKWGVQVMNNGKQSAKTLFNDNLSGVKLSIDLPIDRSYRLECKC